MTYSPVLGSTDYADGNDSERNFRIMRIRTQLSLQLAPHDGSLGGNVLSPVPSDGNYTLEQRSPRGEPCEDQEMARFTISGEGSALSGAPSLFGD